jgi:beta-keto acid cleavage enzyme
MRPVTIAVAITGSVPRKKDNPALPVLPAEQIESTHAAYEAGGQLSFTSMCTMTTSLLPRIPVGLPRCRWAYASTVLGV